MDDAIAYVRADIADEHKRQRDRLLQALSDLADMFEVVDARLHDEIGYGELEPDECLDRGPRRHSQVQGRMTTRQDHAVAPAVSFRHF